jgi:hypothetical protein
MADDSTDVRLGSAIEPSNAKGLRDDVLDRTPNDMSLGSFSNQLKMGKKALLDLHRDLIE